MYRTGCFNELGTNSDNKRELQILFLAYYDIKISAAEK